MLLREIRERIENPGPKVVLANLTLECVGTAQELRDWLSKNGTPKAGSVSYAGIDFPPYSMQQLDAHWSHPSNGLYQFARIFVDNLTTDDRLNVVSPAPSVPFTQIAPSHPLHHLYLSIDLENRISKLSRKAFGTDIVVNRLGGTHIPLHFGERPHKTSAETEVSDAYIRKVEKLPLVQTQGDGIRSFLGVVLSAFVGDRDILLIDEPEAFLHPAQARLLGRMLAIGNPSYRQLLLATHSGDFLKGIINTQSARVRIVRIRRDGNVNVLRELDQKGISELWRDPLLRYSNALDGLFHERVVVCEADADCRFYGAILDAMHEDQLDESPLPDLLFIHCGGKHRVPVLIRALRALDVPVATAVDFDVLQDQRPLRDIFEALGGTWSTVEVHWRAVKTCIDQKKAYLKTADVRKEINSVIDSVTQEQLPSDASEKIRAVLRSASPWLIAKEVGSAILPGGEITITFETLLKMLKAVGLHVVEHGELESFDKSIGGHGPAWVNEVVRKDLGKDPTLAKAREFVNDLTS